MKQTRVQFDCQESASLAGQVYTNQPYADSSASLTSRVLVQMVSTPRHGALQVLSTTYDAAVQERKQIAKLKLLRGGCASRIGIII